jgi:hypothetical protein
MDLKDLKEGLGALVRADDAIEHLTRPDTVARIVGAGLEAAVVRARVEVAGSTEGAARAPVIVRSAQGGRPNEAPATGPKPHVFQCHRHGLVLWQGTIACARCDRVYQVANPAGERYAPAVCVCTVRLLPVLGKPEARFSGARICPTCFRERALRQSRSGQ